MKYFEVFTRDGRSLLPPGKTIQVDSAEEALQHVLEETNGQYAKKDIEVKEVFPEPTEPPHPPNTKSGPSDSRKCLNCEYDDPAGADTCPNCGQ